MSKEDELGKEILGRIAELLGRKIENVYPRSTYTDAGKQLDAWAFNYYRANDYGDLIFVYYKTTVTIYLLKVYEIRNRLMVIDLNNPKSLTRAYLRNCVKECQLMIRNGIPDEVRHA